MDCSIRDLFLCFFFLGGKGPFSKALLFALFLAWLSVSRLPAAISSNQHGSILPALAFSLDMFSKTDSSYGVNEVLLASVLGSVVFAIFSAQPLVIVGVTGRLFNLFIMRTTLNLKITQDQLQSSIIRFMKSWFHAAPTISASCAGSDCLHIAILGTRTFH